METTANTSNYVGSSVRETQLAFERDKISKQESFHEERKQKNEKMKKEISDLRNSNKHSTSTEGSSHSTSSNPTQSTSIPTLTTTSTSTSTHDKKLKTKKIDNKETNHNDNNSITSSTTFTSQTNLLSPREDIFESKELESTTTSTTITRGITPPPTTQPQVHTPQLENPENFPLLILENCQIVDVEAGELSPNHHIIISLDGRIDSMGSSSFIPHIKSWMRYDCQNHFILPGLCDAHTNISVPSEISSNHSTKSSSSYRAISATHILKSLLHCGFTTIRDISGVDSGILQAVSENLLDSPRILSSGMAIGPKGTFLKSSHDNILNSSIYSCPHSTHCNHKCSSWCGWNVESGENQLRDYIQSLVQSQNISQLTVVHGNYCVDSFLNSSTSSAVSATSASYASSSPSSIVEREYPLFSRAEYEIISEECSLINLPILACCNTKIPIQRAVNIGAKCIDGGMEINDEIAQQMKDINCSLVPILSTSFLSGIIKNNSTQNQLTISQSLSQSQSLSSLPSPSPQQQQQQQNQNSLKAVNQIEDQLTSVNNNNTHHPLSSSGSLDNNQMNDLPFPNCTTQQSEYYHHWTSLLTLSTDYHLNVVYGSNLHSNQFLKSVPSILSWYLQSSTLSPVHLLRSLTCSAAQLFNLSELIGTVSVGAIADLIMIQNNPLIDNKWYSTEDSICVVIQRGRIKKLHRLFRESLYLLDEETQETTPMITQETIGRKFTYGSNSNVKDKKKPWKPPGPILPIHENSTSTSTTNNPTKHSSHHSHGHGQQCGRSLSSVSTSTKGDN